MVSLTIQLDEKIADHLLILAKSQRRPAEELALEAIAEYTRQKLTGRPLPKGIGAYRSGRSDVSAHAREILRDAARSGEWP